MVVAMRMQLEHAFFPGYRVMNALPPNCGLIPTPRWPADRVTPDMDNLNA